MRSDASALHQQIIEPLNQTLSKCRLIMRQDSNNREAEVVICVVAVSGMSGLFTGRGIMGAADSHLFFIIASHLKPSVLFEFILCPVSKSLIES